LAQGPQRSGNEAGSERPRGVVSPRGAAMGYTLHAKFAGVLTSVAFAIYALPLASCVMLGFDRYTALPMGRYPLIALGVLPLVFFVYIRQRKLPTPNHNLATILAVTPATVFFVLGFAIMLQSQNIADRLNSSGCPYVPSTERLVHHAAEAAEFHRLCSKGLADDERVLIQTCPGYEDMLSVDEDRATDWAVLKQMEHDFFCAGFCEPPPSAGPVQPLWTFTGTKVEPCGVMVAMHLRSYTRATGSQIFWFGGAVLIAYWFWTTLFWSAIKAGPAPRVSAPAQPDDPSGWHSIPQQTQ